MDRARRVAFAAGAVAAACLAGPAPSAQPLEAPSPAPASAAGRPAGPAPSAQQRQGPAPETYHRVLPLAGVPVAGEPLRRQRPAPETYHWVLPADQSTVEVATLHPGDCYVVQAAEGLAYFGEPTPALRALQDRLPGPAAHRVATRADHAECALGACVRTARVAAALEREMASIDRRLLRRADHRPAPIDRWYGGAYTDVGSADRETFRRAPEQRMLFRHLSTARRGNCYAARAPRTLTIHVRDQGRRRRRTGVYHGFLYVEHHHPAIAGAAAD